MLRLIVVAVLSLALPQAQARKKRSYMHGDDPHKGHDRAKEGEFYPGHHHNDQHPYLAPSHEYHKLQTFAMQCDLEKVHELLRAGVPVDFPHQHSSDTALMYASMNHSYSRENGPDGSLPCVKLLLAYHANVEASDSEGRTALHQAAQHGSVPIIKALLAAGAHPERKVEHGVDRGMTAADIADRHKCPECVTVLRAAEEHVPGHSAALDRRAAKAAADLQAAMNTYATFDLSGWYARYVEGYPDGDECALHRALDYARATPGVDPKLIERGQALRSGLEENTMDVLERRHVCKEVAPYLLNHGLHSLADLQDLSLRSLAWHTRLEPFEAHMLQRAINDDVKRHQRHERYREHDRKKAAEEEAKVKDEMRRRLQEAGARPCGGQ